MFTVRKLASLAGVTPRSLHYYDEIGLLPPARIAENGYRCYDEGSLLRLQQILLYRELDLPLAEIKRILDGEAFDALISLRGHQETLRQRIKRTKKLIASITDTIQYLEGKKEMDEIKMFEPFNEKQQAEYEVEVAEKYDPRIVKASQQKWKSYSREDKQRIGEEGNAVYRDFVLAIPKGPTSPEAQDCVRRWRAHMAYFWEPDDEQCQGLANLYNNDPRFKANFDKIDPRLAEFVRESVRYNINNISS
jgi:MerR family transcriptional regulator, thiopeptide resistance regulator